MQTIKDTSFIGAYQCNGILRYLGPQNPELMKKVIRSLIMESHELFHITVNPPAMLPTFDTITLSELFLEEQYDFILRKLQENTRLLCQFFTEFMFVPERTREGVIHIHCIAQLRNGRLDTDIKRAFWNIFEINRLKSERDKKNAMKVMVHYEPVENDGIIQYLFNKDKKDYESIYNLKNAKGDKYYQCMTMY